MLKLIEIQVNYFISGFHPQPNEQFQDRISNMSYNSSFSKVKRVLGQKRKRK